MLPDHAHLLDANGLPKVGSGSAPGLCFVGFEDVSTGLLRAIAPRAAPP